MTRNSLEKGKTLFGCVIMYQVSKYFGCTKEHEGVGVE